MWIGQVDKQVLSYQSPTYVVWASLCTINDDRVQHC